MSWFRKKEVWIIIILLAVVLMNKGMAQIKLKYSNRGPEILLEDIHIPEKVVEEKEEEIELKTIKVDISGAVMNSGVYILKEGNRIEDVVLQAGGFTEEADLNQVNQADYIYDGQKIIILKVGENMDSIQGLTKGPINLNTANKEQLSTLNGIGEKTADKIIAYRQNNGPFSTVEDLMKVSGIGASKLDGIRGEIVVN